LKSQRDIGGEVGRGIVARRRRQDEEKFGEEKLPPLVGFGNPPLTITDKSFAVHNAKDEEDPRKRKKKGI